MIIYLIVTGLIIFMFWISTHPDEALRLYEWLKRELEERERERENKTSGDDT